MDEKNFAISTQDLNSGSENELLSSTSDELSEEEIKEEIEVDIDDIIEEFGCGLFQIRLVCIAGLMSFVDTMEMMLLSYIGLAIRCVWDVADSLIAMLSTVVFVGMTIGAVSFGSLSDNYGRKKILLVSNILLFLSGFSSAFSFNFWFLLVSRFLVGITISGAHNSVTLMTEYVPKYYRGSAFVTTQIFSAFGVCFEALLAWIILPKFGDYSWRMFFGASAVPILLYIVLLVIFIPESARYLLAKGFDDDAKSLLKSIAHSNNKEYKENWKLKSSSQTVINSNQNSFGIVQVLSKGMWKTSLKVWSLWMITVFFYYGSVLLTVEIVKLDEKGLRCNNGNINNSIANLTNTTGNCYLSDSAFFEVLLLSSAELPAVFIGWLLIDRLGRKKLALASYIIAAICSFLFNFCLPNILTRIIQFVMRGAIAIAFQCLYVLTPEIYPTSVRSLGLGLSSSFGRIGGVITPFIAVSIFSIPNIGPPLALNIYGCMSVIASLITLLLPKDTLGEKLEEYELDSITPKINENDDVENSMIGFSNSDNEDLTDNNSDNISISSESDQ